jgi:ATP-dependent RNA helicase RhlE
MESLLFSDFKLIEQLNRAVRDVGYVTPTPVQVQSIPPLLGGRDLLGCAQTGTGKTAAFALPILQRLATAKRPRQRGVVRALIVTPTRELAIQIDQSMRDYAKYVDVVGAVVFGGVGQGLQVKALERGVDVLVATPGRLLDLMNQGHVRIDAVEIFVLDEADRMLDMGFLPDVKRILQKLPRKRQTMFFSATLPPDIVKLANTMVTDPVSVNVTPETPVVELIDQRMMYVERNDKLALLERLFQGKEVSKALVFTRTKHGANKLVKILDRQGIRSQAIHGNKAQTARQKALEDFKAGRVRVLVATDIAARGIDVEGISHVINYEIPNIPETYVHRIGRTARAGSAGVAVSFCDREERSWVRDIERLLKKSVPVVRGHPFHSDAAEASTAAPPPQGGRGRRQDHGYADRSERRESRGPRGYGGQSRPYEGRGQGYGGRPQGGGYRGPQGRSPEELPREGGGQRSFASGGGDRRSPSAPRRYGSGGGPRKFGQRGGSGKPGGYGSQRRSGYGGRSQQGGSGTPGVGRFGGSSFASSGGRHGGHGPSQGGDGRGQQGEGRDQRRRRF